MKTILSKYLLILTSVPTVLIICIFFDKISMMIKTEEDEEIIQRIRGPLLAEDARLVTYLKEHYLFAPSNKPYHLSEGNNEIYMKFSKEDTWRFIYYYTKKLFSGEPPGFFVEAGALDGEFLSNTLWLEQTLGWTGLLIEPNVDSFLHLQHKHRHGWTSNTCLSSQPFAKETVHVNVKFNSKLYPKAVHWNYRGTSHEFGVNINVKDALIGDETFLAVQCFPLITYLLALNVTTVDFLSLDIQGGEKTLLRNIPWQSVKIRVIAVEIFDEELDRDFIKYMEDNEYSLVSKRFATKLHDHMYVRKDEKYLLEKLSMT